MTHFLRFLSRVAIDTLKGIGTGLLVTAFFALCVAILGGLVWTVGYALLHLTPITLPASAKGSPEMNFGVFMVLGSVALTVIVSFGWEVFKALRQRWRETI